MKQRAFTLIELLVVIAIIAILAAILFPVFAQAKMAAKKTQSLSNSKNQITAIIMYAGDTDDVLPFSEGGCDANGVLQFQWYATVYPYIKNGKTEVGADGNLRAWGNDGIFRDPAHPDQNQGQQYGLNRDIFPGNYCMTPESADWQNPTSATAVDNPADKVAVGIKNRNGPFWSYPYFAPEEWMWTARYKNENGSVVSDGSEIMSGLAPRDWGYVMNKDCYDPNTVMEECGAGLSYRYNGQTIVSYLDGHAAAAAKGRLQWWKNVAFNNGARWWKQSWYPYNGF